MDLNRRMVLVEWRDSNGQLSWATLDQHPNSAECLSISFLLKTTKKDIVMAGSFDGQNHYTDWNTIPKSAVERIRRLRVH